jgi:hypothetical protein
VLSDAAAAAGFAAFKASVAAVDPEAAAAPGIAAFFAVCRACYPTFGDEATPEAVPSHMAAVAYGHAASTVATPPPPYVGRDLVCFHGLLCGLVHDWFGWIRTLPHVAEPPLDSVVDWLLSHPRRLLAGFAARHCPRSRCGQMSKLQLAQFLADHVVGEVREGLFPQCNASSA